nr:hypothetical protein [Tanacetum cinerariifolium]
MAGNIGESGCSRFTWVFFLATKDETSYVLKSFITRIENLVDHKVKVIRCDNRVKFKNREMNQFCKMKGILRKFRVARTPQQNGVTKRRNMTLIEAARIMLVDSKYPIIILNIIDHLGKFDGTVDEGFFVGYSLNSKAFRVFNSRTKIVEENLHIRFGESTPNVVGSEPNWLFDIDALTRTINYEPIVADPKSSHNDGSKPSSDNRNKVDEDLRKENECNDQEKEDNVNNTNNVNIVSSTVNAAGTNKDNELQFDLNMPALKDVSTFNFLGDDEDDGSMANMNNLDTTIQKDPSWIEAMQKELLKFKLQEVWTLVYLPNEKKAIGTKWAFRNKKDERGIMIRNKVRLVAQGYTQEEEIDFDEVFTLVARIEAIRLFLAYASFENFVVYQIDVKSAFLYGKIEEEVYVCQPPGFKDPDFPDRVYKKKDEIFISQYKYVAEILKKYGFTKVKTASTPMETQKPLLKDEDGEEVDVHMYRSMTGSLMYLTSSRPDIMFAVCAYARYQVNLKVLHLHAVKRIFSTPMETQKPLLKDEDGEEVDVHMYRSMTGSLMYLTSSRPDIMFAVCAYARYQVNLKVPQPSDPMEHVVDEVVHKELGDSLVKAATTASSLEAKQNNGYGPRCQEAMGDTTAQTRVLDLEKTKTTQSNEIASLKRRVKKLEKKNRSKTHKLKRLYKVCLTARVESSDDKESFSKDVSKQGRIEAIDADEDITIVNVQDDAKIFDVNDLGGDELFVLKQEVVKDVNANVVEEVVNAAQDSTATATITTKEITLAQALEALKNLKPKDKGKGIMIDETVKPKKKDQIRLDEEDAKREDLEDLYKLVKAKFKSTRLVEDLDLLLWGDVKTMFKPHVDDRVWKLQQRYKVLNWKLYDSYGVHSLMMQSMHVYMLFEKTYPLTSPTLSMMLEVKLQIDYQSEMAYQLLKLIKKQLKK